MGLCFEWGIADGWNTDIVVPIDFRKLNFSTMRVSVDNYGVRTFFQKFNPLKAPSSYSDELRGKIIEIKSDNLMYVQYPFGEPPVKVALKTISNSRKYQQQLSEKVRGSAHPDEIVLEIERLRYARSSQLMRKKRIADAQVRKIFGLPVDHWFVPEENALEVTDYYRAYRLIEYLKYLKKLREHLLFEFNRQVVQKIATRNSLDPQMQIDYVGKQPTELEIEIEYQNFKHGEIQFHELVELLIRN